MKRPYWVVRAVSDESIAGLYVRSCAFKGGMVSTVWAKVRGKAIRFPTLRDAMSCVVATSIGHAMVTRAVRVVRKTKRGVP